MGKYSKKDYHMLINKLQEEYSKDPKRVNKEAYNSLYKIGKIRSEGLEKFINNIGAVILLLLIPFLFIGKYYSILALAGLAFYSAMYLVLKDGSSNAIIFIYSHGLTGYIMMNAEMFLKIINSPIFSDGATKIVILLGVSLLLAISQCIYATLYCLSDDLQATPFNRSIPVILGAISTVIIHLTYIFMI